MQMRTSRRKRLSQVTAMPSPGSGLVGLQEGRFGIVGSDRQIVVEAGGTAAGIATFSRAARSTAK